MLSFSLSSQTAPSPPPEQCREMGRQCDQPSTAPLCWFCFPTLLKPGAFLWALGIQELLQHRPSARIPAPGSCSAAGAGSSSLCSSPVAARGSNGAPAASPLLLFLLLFPPCCSKGFPSASFLAARQCFSLSCTCDSCGAPLCPVAGLLEPAASGTWQPPLHTPREQCHIPNAISRR